MNTKTAIKILQALVQGVDPESGDELGGNGVLQKAQVLRALLAAIGSLEQCASRETRRSQLPTNVGTPWSADDERSLVQQFQSGESFADIAKVLGRTIRAVEARAERLGLISRDQRTTENTFT